MSIKKYLLDIREKLDGLTKREFTLLLLLTPTLLFFFSFKFLLPVLDTKLQHTKNSLHTEHNNTTIQELKSILDAKQNDEQALANAIKDIQTKKETILLGIDKNKTIQLNSKSQADFLNFLSSSIAKNKLSLNHIKPTQKSHSTIYQLDFIGEFKNILLMLNEIENSNFLLTIDHFTLDTNNSCSLYISLHGIRK